LQAGSRIRAENLEPGGTRMPVPNYGFRKWNFRLAAGGRMARILHETLLLCSMAAFVVGVVIAAASLPG
jgi:hypothetical protein